MTGPPPLPSPPLSNRATRCVPIFCIFVLYLLSPRVASEANRISSRGLSGSLRRVLTSRPFFATHLADHAVNWRARSWRHTRKVLCERSSSCAYPPTSVPCKGQRLFPTLRDFHNYPPKPAVHLRLKSVHIYQCPTRALRSSLLAPRSQSRSTGSVSETSCATSHSRCHNPTWIDRARGILSA